MKFSINTTDLLDGISTAARALPSKSVKPVYDGACVTCEGNTISILCSDGQLSVRWTGTASVTEEGTSTIPGKLFADLIRKLPAGNVTITTDSRSASVSCGKSRSRLAVIPGDFPPDGAVENGITLSLPAIALKDLILHVFPAIAVDESRPILTGALMEVTPERMTMVALDGFRLALKHHTQDFNLNGKDHVRAVIPRKTLSDLSKILPNSDDPVSISLSDSAISVSVGPSQVTSTLICGEYINYAKIIPEGYTSSILVRRDDLQNAIERASLMARDGKNNLVKLDIRDNTVSVSSQSDTGNISEDVDCDHQGNPITIAFNAAYITDAIRNAPDDTVSIRFTSPLSPAIIYPQGSPDWLFLVLPVRTNT